MSGTRHECMCGHCAACVQEIARHERQSATWQAEADAIGEGGDGWWTAVKMATGHAERANRLKRAGAA